MATKGREPKVSDEKLLQLVETSDEWLDRPFVTAKELAERVGMTRQAIHKRLQQFVDDGKIRKYKPGKSAIWWVED